MSVPSGFGPIRLLVIQPTSLCNLDCTYCYLPDRSRRHLLDGDLVGPILQRVLESPFVGEGFTILWHAGEPLTRSPSFYDQATDTLRSLLRAHPGPVVDQSVQTNGTLINDHWCACFERNGIDVGVSLDGPAFLHDPHRRTRRGLGSHADTMRGVRCLQEAGIPFSVISVLTRTSLHHADALVDFYLENGIAEVGFNMEETEGVHLRSSLAEEGTEALYRRFLERVWDRVAEAGGALRIREFEDFRAFAVSGNRIDHTDLNRPMAIVSVDHQGNFSTFDPELLSVETRYGLFQLGNVREDSLEAACRSDRFGRIWADMREGIERCRASCAYFGLCGGGAGSNKYW
ncbi:MAG: cyclophane-forming radical SAM/SPASM peptide maturase GrrM/OscB, partial [Synechococcaceae cyanobacterium]|nr:cyclophane-forming radical SAM/SPASM peptide maturase GrrM/OscB [Synechococcaceae cyanobacterium]